MGISSENIKFHGFSVFNTILKLENERFNFY